MNNDHKTPEATPHAFPLGDDGLPLRPVSDHFLTWGVGQAIPGELGGEPRGGPGQSDVALGA